MLCKWSDWYDNVWTIRELYYITNPTTHNCVENQKS